MTAFLIAIGVAAGSIILWGATRTFFSRRQSGPDNNWANEANAAARRAGSWTESQGRSVRSNDLTSFVDPT